MQQFEKDPLLTDLLDATQIQRLEASLGRLGFGKVRLSEGFSEAAVAVEFNLETVAWLSADCPRDTLIAMAELISFVLFFVAKYRLAANIHYSATESGYAELQEKHKALQESESRYKALSDQLQERVDEQVATIENAQKQLYKSAKTRAVGQLSAGVAHEINNPIGFIKSNLKVAGDYLSELEVKLPRDEQTRELLADFRDLLDESIDGSDRIAAIVADLKTFSSIDHADYTECNVNELVKASLNLLKTTDSGNTVSFDTEFASVPNIFGNPAHLSEAFYNVLDNAAKAVTDDGRIIVKTATSADGNVAVLIQDNGCGIPASEIEHVFDPFFTSRPVGAGTGLGLTVAQDTLRAHQGKIRVKSIEGRGTRVTMLLPKNS